MFKRFLYPAFFAAAASLALPAAGHAQSIAKIAAQAPLPPTLTIGGRAVIPDGWSEHCLAEPGACPHNDGPPAFIELTPATRDAFVDIARQAREALTYVPYISGELDIPADKIGDCKSFVIEALDLARKKAKFPDSAMLPAMVTKRENGQGHAVLVLRFIEDGR